MVVIAMKPLTLRHEIDEVIHDDCEVWAILEVMDLLEITFYDRTKSYEDGEIYSVIYAPTDSVRFMWE